MYREIEVITKDGAIRVYRISNCINGNPRYVVHYSSLGLKDYVSSNLTRSLGLKKYRGKWFGGGFVFQSYNLEESLNYFISNLTNQLT